MESFGHKMFISSQPVPLTGRGVLYLRVRDFLLRNQTRAALQSILGEEKNKAQIQTSFALFLTCYKVTKALSMSVSNH